MNKLDLSDPSRRVLPKLLQQQAREAGDKPFLLDRANSISFARAHATSDRLAGGLANLSVGAGDRVVFYLENRVETVLLALAVNKLRAIWVPVSTDYKGAWLEDSLKRSRPKLVVTQASLVDRVVDVGVDADIVVLDDQDRPVANTTSYATLLNSPARQFPLDEIHYGETCSIIWTSGTTGRSKGVMVSHNGWLRPVVLGSSVFYESCEGDVILNVLPLFHAAAWNTCIFRALAEGIPVAIEPGFSVSDFWQRVNQYRATQTFTLGAMHLFLLNTPERDSDADNSLRVMQAVPMPAHLVDTFEHRFGVRLLGNGLGQSECMLITSEAGVPPPIPENSIGKPKPDSDVRLFDDDDNEVAVNEVGEIRIRELEPHIVCNGYFDDPEATEAAWRGDWFCTGDLGRKDEGGFLFFVDRKKDAVRFAGRNISTQQVEAVVRQHPDIADVVAYGIPDKVLEAEDELKVDMILKPGSNTRYEDIARFINDNAPYYFVPRYMNFVEAIPYTPTNKAQKYKLREKGVLEDTWDLRQSDFEVQR